MHKPVVLLFLFSVLLAFSGFSQGISAGKPILSSTKAIIRFEENANQQFGFDALQYPEWSDDYDIWQNALVPDYTIPFKSVGFNQTDVVDARILTGTRFAADSLAFEITGTHTILHYKRRTKQLITLSLPAMTANYTVSAYYNGKELGRLQVIVYHRKEEKIIVVPLFETPFSKDSLETRLNRIYRQANVRLNVEVKPLFTHPDHDENALFDNPSPAFDRYTNQMRTVRDLYFDAHPNADRGAFYVFLVPGFTDPDINGYMVNNKALAFVKLNPGPKLAKVTARQLARGIGILKDSWLDQGPVLGTTDNLMDKAKGARLRYVQWEELRHSGHSYSIYDNYEDVRTNNGFVAYYFWKQDTLGNIVPEKGGLLFAIKRPFKKNFLSYHLNIDNFFFKTLFRIKGRLVCLWHILAFVAIVGGSFWGKRKLNKYLTKRFKRPGMLKLTSRAAQLVMTVVLTYLTFLLINLGYRWFEVPTGPVRELQQLSTDRAIRRIALNVNYKHPTEPGLCSELLIKRRNTWYRSKRRQVLYFAIRQDASGEWKRMRLQADSDSLILVSRSFAEKAESHYVVFNYIAKDGSFHQQRVYNHLGVDITDKLTIPDPAKRILLFVNGYRPTSIGHTFEENFKDIQQRGFEFPDSRNLVYTFDRYDYWRPWQAIDLLFQKRINPGETYYADGHFSVSTSNHRSLINFTTTSTIYPKRCPNQKKHTCYSTTSVNSGIFGSRTVKTLSLHNTRPNRRGFEKRRRNGRIAGRNIYQMLNELPNHSENDTLYIVAHSMGYAYALGIADELRGKIRFGGFYIIAPENATSGTVQLSEWKEVWQYGSNFGTRGQDAPCLLDGVAPQARAGGLHVSNRIFIPRELYRKKGFFDSHFIGYYSWVLDIPKGKSGYITQR